MNLWSIGYQPIALPSKLSCCGDGEGIRTPDHEIESLISLTTTPHHHFANGLPKGTTDKECFNEPSSNLVVYTK